MADETYSIGSLDPLCIRCDESPVVDGLGYCGHCHWAVKAEIEAGIHELSAYLLSWARFSDWCSEHGLEA